MMRGVVEVICMTYACVIGVETITSICIPTPEQLRKEDAVSSYNRLQDGLPSVKTDATAIAEPKREMQIQTTSLQVLFLLSFFFSR